MERVTTKRMALYSGRTHLALAEEIAEHLGVELGNANLVEFANGELRPRFAESVRGADVFIMQTHYGCDGRSINDSIMEQLIMIDAAYRASAKRITAVCPFYGYGRQDRNADLAFINKRRPKGMANVAVAKEVIGEVDGRHCVITDDMIDTASTIASAAEILLERGATEVWAMATHGVLSGPAIDRLKNSPVARIVLTNTLPLPPEKQIDKIEVLSVAPIIADALNAVFDD